MNAGQEEADFEDFDAPDVSGIEPEIEQISDFEDPISDYGDEDDYLPSDLEDLGFYEEQEERVYYDSEEDGEEIEDQESEVSAEELQEVINQIEIDHYESQQSEGENNGFIEQDLGEFIEN